MRKSWLVSFLIILNFQLALSASTRISPLLCELFFVSCLLQFQSKSLKRTKRNAPLKMERRQTSLEVVGLGFGLALATGISLGWLRQLSDKMENAILPEK